MNRYGGLAMDRRKQVVGRTAEPKIHGLNKSFGPRPGNLPTGLSIVCPDTCQPRLAVVSYPPGFRRGQVLTPEQIIIKSYRVRLVLGHGLNSRDECNISDRKQLQDFLLACLIKERYLDGQGRWYRQREVLAGKSEGTLSRNRLVPATVFPNPLLIRYSSGRSEPPVLSRKELKERHRRWEARQVLSKLIQVRGLSEVKP